MAEVPATISRDNFGAPQSDPLPVEVPLTPLPPPGGKGREPLVAEETTPVEDKAHRDAQKRKQSAEASAIKRTISGAKPASPHRGGRSTSFKPSSCPVCNQGFVENSELLQHLNGPCGVSPVKPPPPVVVEATQVALEDTLAALNRAEVKKSNAVPELGPSDSRVTPEILEAAGNRGGRTKSPRAAAAAAAAEPPSSRRLAELDSLIEEARTAVVNSSPGGQQGGDDKPSSIECSVCGTLNEQGVKACSECGTMEGFSLRLSRRQTRNSGDDDEERRKKLAEEEATRLRKEAAERARVARVEKAQREKANDVRDEADGSSSSFNSALGSEEDGTPPADLPLEEERKEDFMAKTHGGLLRIKAEPGRAMSRNSLFAVDAGGNSSDEESSD